MHTPRVLAVLDQHQVKATFFMMGRNVERYPEVAREVMRRGHEIGNHSYSHPKLVLMSPRRVREEIERTDTLLRDIGVSGEIHFRPPHASKFIVLPYVLVQMKKLSVFGDVDPEEWKRPSAAVMTESILRQVRPGSIIGLHDPLGAETLSCLQFQMGFFLFVPFLLIDLVVSTTLLSMGMLQLPPAMIWLPFKVLLFVMIDGWNLVVGSIVRSL